MNPKIVIILCKINYREQRVNQYMRTFFTRFDKFYHRDTNIKKTGIVYEFYEAYAQYKLLFYICTC